MEHEHFTYPEAIRYLANKYNIEIEETVETDEDKEKANEKKACIWFLNLREIIFTKPCLKQTKDKPLGFPTLKKEDLLQQLSKNFN